MGSDQIAEIAPAVREILGGGSGWIATFEVTGDPTKWVQFEIGCINAAYLSADAPSQKLGGLPAFALLMWEPNKYLTGSLDLSDPRSIARWIDDYYFSAVLECADDYSIDVGIARL
ncbi:hypothetical protein [Bradyrhizobium sp. ORS 285]|uniref:hypothetical protein n=1 Tax=Bradyrhizobium sp. ORS 285 TaxID=115808 RepID=UPI0002E49CE5|nr:hypothetical protein [Bradyrhizobium sp. ORS 285]